MRRLGQNTMSVRLCSDGDDEAGDGLWVHLVVLLEGSERGELLR